MAKVIKCKVCGANVPKKMNFCASCGAAVEKNDAPNLTDLSGRASNTSENTKVRGIKLKIIIVPAVFVAALIAIFAFSAAFLKPANYELYKRRTIITQVGNRIAILPEGKNKVYIDGKLGRCVLNPDTSKAAFLMYEEIDGSSSGASLYLVDEKVQFIDNDVYWYQISAPGNSVAYLKERDSSERTAQLWLYSDGKKTLIAQEIHEAFVFFLSPDGSTICYTTYDGKDYTGYIWDGELHALEKNCIPFAVADGAKYVYYRDSGNILYVQKGKNNEDRVKLADDTVFDFAANKDLSQLILNAGDAYYISSSGEALEPLDGFGWEHITSNGIAKKTYKIFSGYSDGSIRQPDLTYISAPNIAYSFYKSAEGTLIHIDSENETNFISQDARFTYLSDSGNILTYMRRDRGIYKLDFTSKNAKPERIVPGDFRFFVALNDGQSVFYVNEDNEMYYKKGNKERVLVAENIQYEQFWEMGWKANIFAGKTIYYMNDGELYFSSGEEGKPVSGIEGEIESVNAGFTDTLVNTTNNGESFLYYSTDGVNFELID
ncbi:MAG: zinc ribbon domain-containing protein [Clostridiales bacterium]|jgi:hypothetical protein|nr:zinc ribbon domain-containing protein [Clostridiales bacterium]